MKAGMLALAIGAPVVLVGGGVAAAVMLRRRGTSQAQDIGTAQALYGSKLVSQLPTPPPPPGKLDPSQTMSAVRVGDIRAGSLADPRVLQGAATVVGKIYPGLAPVAGTAASVVSALDSKIGTGLLRKVPGLGSLGSKLKLW